MKDGGPARSRKRALALRIVHAADLIVMPLSSRTAKHVRKVGPVLEVGPRAPLDTIVTIACRHHLRKRGELGERAVKSRVERWGFTYVATGPRGTRRALGPRAARPQSGLIGRGVKEPSCA